MFLPGSPQFGTVGTCPGGVSRNLRTEARSPRSTASRNRFSVSDNGFQACGGALDCDCDFWALFVEEPLIRFRIELEMDCFLFTDVFMSLAGPWSLPGDRELSLDRIPRWTEVCWTREFLMSELPDPFDRVLATGRRQADVDCVTPELVTLRVVVTGVCERVDSRANVGK